MKQTLRIVGLSAAMSMLFSAYAWAAPDTTQPEQHKQVVLQLESHQATIGGEMIALEQAPVLLRDTTVVPLRFVSEALGADVSWNQEKQEIRIEKGERVIVMTIGERQADVDGTKRELEEAPENWDGTTMVPTRFIAEQMNHIVTYDHETRRIVFDPVVSIEKPKPAPEPTPEPEIAPQPVRLDKPTVTNLSWYIGEGVEQGYGPQYNPYQPGIVSPSHEDLSQLIIDHNDDVYMIYKEANPFDPARIVRYQSNPESFLFADMLKAAIAVDDRFLVDGIQMQAKDVSIRKLFANEANDRLYAVAAVSEQSLPYSNGQAWLVIYQVKPDVRVVTAFKQRDLDVDDAFFVSPWNGSDVYFSNIIKDHVYYKEGMKLDTVTSDELSGEKRPKLTPLIQDNKMYVLDRANQVIYEWTMNGRLQEKTTLKINETITGATTRDGMFYVATPSSVYTVQLDGTTKLYVKWKDAQYPDSLGIYNPLTKEYEKRQRMPVGSTDRLMQGTSVIEPNRSIDFVVDSLGNMILYDTGSHGLRKLTLFELPQPAASQTINESEKK